MSFYSDIERLFANKSYGIVAPAHAQPIGESKFRPTVINNTKNHAEDIRRQITKPLVHIGFAGFFNFDLIAVSRPDYAILCDINDNQAIFWNEVCNLIDSSPTPDSFMKKWMDRLIKEDSSKAVKLKCANGKEFICRMSPKENYFQDCKWLEKENYRFLRQMVKKKKIVPVTFSITDVSQAQKLSDYMAQNAYEVSSIYASNISETMSPRIAPAMKDAVKKAQRKGENYLEKILNNTPQEDLIVYPDAGFYREQKSGEPPYILFQKTLGILATEYTLISDVPGTNIGERIARPLITYQGGPQISH